MNGGQKFRNLLSVIARSTCAPPSLVILNKQKLFSQTKAEGIRELRASKNNFSRSINPRQLNSAKRFEHLAIKVVVCHRFPPSTFSCQMILIKCDPKPVISLLHKLEPWKPFIYIRFVCAFFELPLSFFCFLFSIKWTTSDLLCMCVCCSDCFVLLKVFSCRTFFIHCRRFLFFPFLLINFSSIISDDDARYFYRFLVVVFLTFAIVNLKH